MMLVSATRHEKPGLKKVSVQIRLQYLLHRAGNPRYNGDSAPCERARDRFGDRPADQRFNTQSAQQDTTAVGRICFEKGLESPCFVLIFHFDHQHTRGRIENRRNLPLPNRNSNLHRNHHPRQPVGRINSFPSPSSELRGPPTASAGP